MTLTQTAFEYCQAAGAPTLLVMLVSMCFEHKKCSALSNNFLCAPSSPLSPSVIDTASVVFRCSSNPSSKWSKFLEFKATFETWKLFTKASLHRVVVWELKA